MIRKQVSDILDYVVPEKGWQSAFFELEKDGRLTNKHVHQMLALLLSLEEQREKLKNRRT